MDVLEILQGLATHHQEDLEAAAQSGKDTLGIARDGLQV